MSVLKNNSTEPFKLLPMKYPWAFKHYKTGVANNWTPEEAPMMDDIELWKSKRLTEEERKLVLWNLGFFSTGEGLTANNIVLTIYKYVTNPECRLYLLRQAFEEANHSASMLYCIDSLSLDPNEVYAMYQTIPSIKDKDDFVINLTQNILDKDFDIEKNPQGLLEDLIGYYIILEGLFFYSSFAMMLALKNQNKMTGVGEQFGWTMKDECQVVNTELLTPYGWKKIRDITYDDEIMQWYPDGTMNFTKPKRLSKTYVNEIYRFKNHQNHFNQAVSENHRMCYINSTGQLKVVAAKDTKPHHEYEFINTGKIRSEFDTKITDYQRFLIAYQADGSSNKEKVRNGKFSGSKYCVFNFKKERKIQRLKEILDRLEWQYKVSPQKDDKTCIYVHVPLEFKVHKTFNKWVNLKKVNLKWCRDFIDELAEWDGNKANKNETRIIYGSVIEANSDIVQAIASLAGYRTHKKTIPDNRKETFSDYHKVSIVKNMNYVTGGSIVKTKEEYNDFVYGVEVDSSFLLIRNENAVSVTGNCVHVEFGVDLINTIKEENPEIWTEELKQTTISNINKAVELEFKFIDGACPVAVAGIPNKLYKQYIKFVADRRLSQLGLLEQYGVENPFPWLAKMMDVSKEKNFFETKPTDYSTGTLGSTEWD